MEQWLREKNELISVVFSNFKDKTESNVCLHIQYIYFLLVLYELEDSEGDSGLRYSAVLANVFGAHFLL